MIDGPLNNIIKVIKLDFKKKKKKKQKFKNISNSSRFNYYI